MRGSGTSVTIHSSRTLGRPTSKPEALGEFRLDTPWSRYCSSSFLVSHPYIRAPQPLCRRLQHSGSCAPSFHSPKLFRLRLLRMSDLRCQQQTRRSNILIEGKALRVRDGESGAAHSKRERQRRAVARTPAVLRRCRMTASARSNSPSPWTCCGAWWRRSWSARSSMRAATTSGGEIDWESKMDGYRDWIRRHPESHAAIMARCT